MAEPGDFGARDRDHLFIDAFLSKGRYVYPSRPPSEKSLRKDYAAHARSLLEQLSAALGQVTARSADERLSLPDLKLGTIVDVSTMPIPDGSRTQARKMPKGLEFAGQDIYLLRTERNPDQTERALIFIPDLSREFLRGRIAAYGRDPGNAKRPDVDKFEVIETISAAEARSLFVGDVDLAAEAVVWWELWVHGSSIRADRLKELARSVELDVHDDRLVFPDTTVIFVHAAAGRLADFVRRVPGAVAEIRRATATIEPFLDRSGRGVGQADWVADLASRVVAAPEGANVICTLDTGVAASHPLLVPGLFGAWAYNASWGADDHAHHGGHGTALAGTVLYGDLEPHMNGGSTVELTHGVESMKLLPPRGFPPTDPPRYGVVTQGCVSLVEVEQPGLTRSFCLATSTNDFPSSRPSSWSGALDQIAAGSMDGDSEDGVSGAKTPKRLIMVATGNVQGGVLPDVLDLKTLEDPSQSWNAITVGGFTRKEQPPAPPPTMTPVVPANHRSPFSLGSRDLPYDLTPIKPEVLFEAGNMVADSAGYCGGHDAVSLLGLGSDVVAEPLVSFWATSAAVGVAGNFIGKLQAALPQLWPETHRALTVDSADWPQPIRKKIIGRGAHWTSGSKGQKQRLLREVGYGVPDIDRAIRSARNDITLIAQADIQPYALGADGRSSVFNEFHFYDLPLPSTVLEELENEVVKLKVTLSYFIEPNLSGRAATRPDTYRSYGLRFALKKRTETAEAFRTRLSTPPPKGGRTSAREKNLWLLGSNAFEAGSLHCDLWRGYAVELAAHDAIAIYPVTGWWKSHLGQKRVTDKGRYALVVSISASGHSVDLHSEVSTLINAKIASMISA